MLENPPEKLGSKVIFHAVVYDFSRLTGHLIIGEGEPEMQVCIDLFQGIDPLTEIVAIWRSGKEGLIANIIYVNIRGDWSRVKAGSPGFNISPPRGYDLAPVDTGALFW